VVTDIEVTNGRSAGNYVLEARVTDETGYTQTPVQAQPPPNGATGYPSAQVSVSSG
jgi:hypothetical protein